MQIKDELRADLKRRRLLLCNKKELDKRIARNFLNSQIYKNSETVLCYASLENEIKTDPIINAALSDGKKTALPFCTDRDGHMKLYYIESLNDVVTKSFGIREPVPELCREAVDFSGRCCCVVPGLAFDCRGYRLGYGKGYYDRFMQNFSFVFTGLCYNDFVIEEIPAQRHDRPVSCIVTECGILTCKQGGERDGR